LKSPRHGAIFGYQYTSKFGVTFAPQPQKDSHVSGYGIIDVNISNIYRKVRKVCDKNGGSYLHRSKECMGTNVLGGEH